MAEIDLPGRPRAAAAASLLSSNRFWIASVFAAACLMPLSGDNYFGLIASRAATYWVLVSGLCLVIGYAGQLAIGYVSLLTVGAYTTSLLVDRLGINPVLAFAAAAVTGAIFGGIIGLPALRLRTFYFAITTFGFATIVTQIALGWTGLTGGGMGLQGPYINGPLGTTWGFYFVCLGLAAAATWLTLNLAESRYGRALVALRDAEVAADSIGISKPRLLLAVFLFSGALAGIAGGLFATLQTYITPDAFTFDLSILFFISILFGGQGSILGPLLGTILLTILPEVAAPLAIWASFLYAALLLAVVLIMPGGIAELLDFRSRQPLDSARLIVPEVSLLPQTAPPVTGAGIHVGHADLRFGSVVAMNDLTLDVHPGEIHGLIGPNGSGKTTTLNAICGFVVPQSGAVTVDGKLLAGGRPQMRLANGIARTFQTPHIVGAVSVLDNVLIGGTQSARTGFLATMLSLPRQRREEAELRQKAHKALRIVGLDQLAAVRANRLQHSELRFIEIARSLMSEPKYLLLDEPAAGLSVEEIRQLGLLIRAIAKAGTGVLLVEHHPDLIFSLCDRVTVLNVGQTLASGNPDQIRSQKEVVHAYLGS